jgi:RNA polymerase sigma factor (sigma-70 family)
MMSNPVQRFCSAALAAGGAGTDAELLAAFRDRRDEAAFAALVRRHGPMVLGVCRRVLGHDADAEDAFQATFLVLARKAGAVSRPGLLANWLYGVAHRAALKARARNAVRRAKERQAPAPAVTEPGELRELLPVLDRELDRLPEHYRGPVVLCELEGRPRKEAAGLLGIPEGTLSSRLAAARKVLARRLARYAPAIPAAALVAALTPGALAAVVPSALETSTVQAMTGAASPAVAALSEEILGAMFFRKLRHVAVIVLAVGMLAGGALFFGARAGGPEKAAPQPRAKAPAAGPKDAANPPKVKPLAPGDRVYIRALNTLPDHPIDGVFEVEETGTVPLGPIYGRVSIKGLLVEDAENAVRDHLKKALARPQVSLYRYNPVTMPDLERRVRQLEQDVAALKAVTEELRKKR